MLAHSLLMKNRERERERERESERERDRERATEREIERERERRVARDVFDTVTTHAGLVYDVTDTGR